MANLQIDCEQRLHLLVARLRGEFDMAGADAFRAAVDPLLQDGSITHLCVDLGGISFVDSSGIGALLGRYRRIVARGGAMSLVRAPAAVQGMLDLSGILRVIPHYDSEQQAIRGA